MYATPVRHSYTPFPPPTPPRARHLPPSHRRLCELSAEIVSKVRSQEPHTNLPCSLVVGGPLAPPRKRPEQAEQSVLTPLGPGPWLGLGLGLGA